MDGQAGRPAHQYGPPQHHPKAPRLPLAAPPVRSAMCGAGAPEDLRSSNFELKQDSIRIGAEQQSVRQLGRIHES